MTSPHPANARQAFKSSIPSLGSLLSWIRRRALASAITTAVAVSTFSTPGFTPPLLAQVTEQMTLSRETREKLERRGRLELRDATLAEALYIISKNWGLNIVVGNDVKGSINGTFEEAPLDQILTSILHSRGYAYKAIGDSLVIMKHEDIGGVQDGFQVAQISLREVPPSEVADLIEILLSPNGRAHGVESAKSIVVVDYPERVKAIRDQLRDLDRSAEEARKEREKSAAEEAGAPTTSGGESGGWLQQALQSIATANANDGTGNSVVTSNTGEPVPGTTQPNNDPSDVGADDRQEAGYGTSGNADRVSENNVQTGAPIIQDNVPSVDVDTLGRDSGSVATVPRQADIDTGLGNLLNGLGGGNAGGPVGATSGDQLNVGTDLTMAIFRPQFVNAAEIVDSVSMLVSEVGQVSVVETENRLVAVDVPRNIAMMNRAVEILDVPRSQVRISSLIFDANLDDLYRIGVNWQNALNGRNMGVVDGNPAAQDSIQLNSLTAANPTGPNGAMTFMSLSRNFNVTAVVNALATSNRSKLVASPSIVVKDRESGRFAIVTEIPYQELTEGLEGGSIGTTAFREAGVTLEVTPAIANDGTIDMIVTPVFSVLSGFTPGDNQPIIDRREATTTVRIANGQTFVLAGLRQRSRVNERSGIPYLRDIRYIGDLFKHKNNEIEDNELIVFVTPQIVGVDALGTAREFRAMQDGIYELENVPESANASRCNPEDPTIQSNGFYGTGQVNTYESHNPPTSQQFRYNSREDENGNFEVPNDRGTHDSSQRDRSVGYGRPYHSAPANRQTAANVANESHQTSRRGSAPTQKTFFLTGGQRANSPQPAENTRSSVVRQATPLSMSVIPFRPAHPSSEPNEVRVAASAEPSVLVPESRLNVNPRTSRRQSPQRRETRSAEAVQRFIR